MPPIARQRAKDDPGTGALTHGGEKGLDTGDKVLAHVMAARVIHMLQMQAKRGKLAVVGKDRGAII